FGEKNCRGGFWSPPPPKPKTFSRLIFSPAPLPVPGSMGPKAKKKNGCFFFFPATREVGTGGGAGTVLFLGFMMTAIILRARYWSAISSMETGGLSRPKYFAI